MFKKFTTEGLQISQVKNSVQRSLSVQIVETYPALEDAIDKILPKKNISVAKAPEYITLIVIDDEILFFQQRDGPLFPTLKLLHKYPQIMPRMQVDKGAVKFILGGANIMCPGFTSAGGNISTPIDKGQPVAIYVEGKQHAIAVGITSMSTEEIKNINKGIAVETVHFLGDCLFLGDKI